MRVKKERETEREKERDREWQRLHTLACSRKESTINLSTREGLDGRRGMTILLALDTFFPGFCLAISASVCRDHQPIQGRINSFSPSCSGRQQLLAQGMFYSNERCHIFTSHLWKPIALTLLHQLFDFFWIEKGKTYVLVCTWLFLFMLSIFCTNY